jgi:hypothetical protein
MKFFPSSSRGRRRWRNYRLWIVGVADYVSNTLLISISFPFIEFVEVKIND